jgi:hypothetical protein
MNKSDKVWEVHYETNQEGWRTKMKVVANNKTSAIGKVARDVANTLTKDVWFRYKDCINITKERNNEETK